MDQNRRYQLPYTVTSQLSDKRQRLKYPVGDNILYKCMTILLALALPNFI